MSSYIVGIDLGGTGIKAGAFTLDGRMIAERHAPTRDGETENGLPAWAAEVARIVADIEKDFEQPARRIGLASPGIAAKDGSTIINMTGRMDGIVGFRWGEHLGREDPVPILNDAHAALLGEVWQGAASGCENVILLTLGTGVGGAAFCDGQLLRGRLGRAGHLGHMTVDFHGALDSCRTPGSIEDRIGNRSVGDRSGGRFSCTADLVAAYEKKEPAATEAWLDSLRALAAHITSLINAFDPEMVLIGGGIADAGESLFDPLAEFMEPIEWLVDGPVEIVPAILGTWSGAFGAAYNALGQETP